MESILYKDVDASIEDDKKIISHLIFEFVAGAKDTEFNQRCTDKIISVIQTKEWQERYKSKHFVHIFDMYTRENIGDIKFMWMCQTLDLLYFFVIYSQRNNAIKLNQIKFDQKIKELFFYVYKKEIDEDTCKTLKMLRNHTTHTGTLEIIKEVLGTEDLGVLDKAIKDKINLRVLAFSFNYLMEDIFMRCLGLSNDDLLRNGNPPQYLIYFKK
jgi:hypothetical protein